MWKIQKIISKGDYNYAVVKEHPSCNKSGYVLEHRIVMENYLGRLLNSSEVVHHINGDKKDNNISNLEVMKRTEHSRMHMLQTGRVVLELQCPECNTVFERNRNNTHVVKNGTVSFCSRSCSGRFQRKVQLHGITVQMKVAISGNILREKVIFQTDNREQTNDNWDA
jgi:hypothetical protein